ncbi:MAG: hypothetical protein AB1629_00885 [Candidatus Omnitrophota bacterium]
MDDILFNYLDPIAKVWGGSQPPYFNAIKKKENSNKKTSKKLKRLPKT